MAVEVQTESEDIIVVGDRVDLVVREGQVYRALIEDRLDDGPFLIAVPSLRGIPMRVEQDDDIYLVFYRESGRYIAQMKVIGLERRGDTRYMWLLQKTAAQRNQRREAYRLPVSFNVQIFDFAADSGTGGAPELAGNSPVLTGNAPIPAGSAPVPLSNTPLPTGGVQNIGSVQGGARAVLLETADSKDISVTGIALITKKQYTLGERYMLSMSIGSEPINPRIPRSLNPVKTIKLAAAVRRSIPWRVNGRYNTGMQFIGIDRDTSDEIAQFVLTEQQRQIKMRRFSR